MLHHLVALYQNTSNYASGMEISPMLWGLGFCIEIKKGIFKNLLVPNCKDIRYEASSSGPLPSAFIFGTYHLLLDLYQVCSYDALGAKTVPAPGGVKSWNKGTMKPIFKILLL